MKTFLFTFIMLMTTVMGYGKEVTFTGSAPSVVEVGERFRLTYSLNQRVDDIQVKRIDGFTMMGPSVSQSSQTQVINGKVSHSVEVNYTYILTAQKEGTFTIPKAIAIVDGKQYEAKAMQIKVVKGSGGNATAGATNSGNQNQQVATNGKISNENLFVRMIPTRRSIYLGESVEVAFKVYSRVDLTDLGRYKFPAFDGFLVEEIPGKQQLEFEREEYNGAIYNTLTVRKVLLYPQQVGELTITPFELECFVQQRVAGGGRSIFDDFFGNYNTVRVPRKSPSLKIDVKELPTAGKTAAFGGIVGHLLMSSSISADSVLANDAVTLKLVFKGKGNLQLLSAPKLNLPLDFESYEPKMDQKFNVSGSGTTGTITIEYLIIPRYAGDYTIPAIEYSYFDTSTRSYKTLSSKPYKIRVVKGKNQVSDSSQIGQVAGAIQSFAKEEIRQVGEDIRYLKTHKYKLYGKGVMFYGTLTYWLCLIIPAIIFIASVLINRRRIAANSDVARVKNRAANKMARKRMKSAEKAIKSGNSDLFFEEVLKAMWGYVSYKLNIDAISLRRDNINDILAERGVDRDTIAQFIEVLDSCEYARYAPADDRKQEMEKIFDQSLNAITVLDRMIK